MTTALFAYGHLIIKILQIKDLNICKFKSSNLLFAIIFTGLIGLILSFFTNINDYIVSFFVTFGLIIFFILYFKKKIPNNKISHLPIIVFLGAIISFYSLSNDDYHIHLALIKVFKEFGTVNNLIDTTLEGNRVSYNSHWLMVTSMLNFKYIPETLYFISSIIYSTILYDTFKLVKNSRKNIDRKGQNWPDYNI